MTISFWVYFGEGVLGSDWNGNEENSMMQTARNILLQLVRVLQKKCTWPPQEELRSWTKGTSLFLSPYLRRYDHLTFGADQKETFSAFVQR